MGTVFTLIFEYATFELLGAEKFEICLSRFLTCLTLNLVFECLVG